MDQDFLLHSGTARLLYHDFAEKMPVIDYHCHISPKEIWEDRRFSTITEAWLEADHYKWRLLRAAGYPETLVSGDGGDREKFRAFANALQNAAGNPIYHWAHLELKQYFDFDGVLTPENADEVYDRCNAALAGEDMSVRGLIRKSNVRLICTTDDPADSLEYHRLLAEDAGFTTAVLPAWRPEKAMSPHLPGYAEYIARLGAAAGVEIRSVAGLRSALLARLDFFEEMGCVASDHSLDGSFYRPGEIEQVEAVFDKGMRGEAVSPGERLAFQSYLMLFLGREYARRGWVMQLHMGPLRNTNPRLYQAAGPDAGGDCIGRPVDPEGLASFLSALEVDDLLPKTVLYSMHPGDNVMLQSLMGCFQGGSAGKMQHGSAWWFNDTLRGMEQQLESLAASGLIGKFIGMLTDSRSFLSYTRHAYFRRILCNFLGGLVERGEYPEEQLDTLGRMVEDICYRNALEYFGFKL
ncbi:MAG: glucuronate isomerase [Candidatus Howiella sp.]